MIYGVKIRNNTTNLSPRCRVTEWREKGPKKKKKAFKKHIVGQTKTGCLTLELAVLCTETRG